MLSSSTTESVSEICSTGLSIDSPMRRNRTKRGGILQRQRREERFQRIAGKTESAADALGGIGHILILMLLFRKLHEQQPKMRRLCFPHGIRIGRHGNLKHLVGHVLGTLVVSIGQSGIRLGQTVGKRWRRARGTRLHNHYSNGCKCSLKQSFHNQPHL